MADLANVSPRTVARWVESGRLPIAQRLPGKTGACLFHRQDVERSLTFTTKASAA